MKQATIKSYAEMFGISEDAAVTEMHRSWRRLVGQIEASGKTIEQVKAEGFTITILDRDTWNLTPPTASTPLTT